MSKKIRFHIRLLVGIVKKYYQILLFVTLASTFVFLLLPRLVRYMVRPPVQKLALVGQYTTSNLPQEVLNLASIGLTKSAPNGESLPAAAKSWSVSPDGLHIKFDLDTSLAWQDGSAFRSSDIGYTIKDVQIQKPDDSTIEFILKDSYAPFPFTVSRPLFKNALIGLSSYRIVDVKSQGSYLNQIRLKSTDSADPQILYKIYPTENAAITAFKLGEVNRVSDLDQKPDLAGWPGVSLSEDLHQDRYVSLIFNTQKDAFTDKNIRQAVSYAIDKSSLGTRALSSYHPQSWAYNAKVKPYDWDADRAKELIQKSNVKDFKFEISVWNTLLPTAEKIQQNLRATGVETTLKVINSLPEDFDALLVWQKIPSDPDQYNLWHSTQETNLSKIKNPKLDKLLEDGRKTQDQNKRYEIYLDFQRFLLEESPAVFLYHPISYSLSR